MKIRKFPILVFMLALLGGIPANAQSVEIFGGFSVQTAEVFDREAFLGLQTSLGVNLAENWGIVADFGRQWRTITETFTGLDLEATTTQYLFGPRYIVRGERASGFVHALFGGGHVSTALAVSENAFMMGFGGGLDVDAGRFLSVRVVQFDWLPSRSSGVWSTKDVRFGFGIVLKGIDD